MQNGNNKNENHNNNKVDYAPTPWTIFEQWKPCGTKLFHPHCVSFVFNANDHHLLSYIMFLFQNTNTFKRFRHI